MRWSRLKGWRAALALGLAAAAAVLWGLGRWNPDSGDALDGLAEAPAVRTIRAMGHGHGVSAAEGRHMHDLVVSHGYRRGLDVGTAHGYSALWFGFAVTARGGSVVTIEIDPTTAEVARANFRSAGLASVIDSRVNDAFEEIPLLDGDFDFVFLDTGLNQDHRFLDLLRARIRPGGAVMAHNATFMRWQQPEFWKAIHDPTVFDTTVFGRVVVAVKRGGT